MNKDKNFSNLTKEQQDKVLSECCEGTNKEQEELVDSVFPSDTFIEEKMKEFRERWKRIEKTITGHISGRKIWNVDLEDEDSYLFVDETLEEILKSSLQSQRQSILEEIEKLPKVQYGVYGSGDLLRDIKQLLKDNKE